jgi:acetyl esterase
LNHPDIDLQMLAATARNDEILRSLGPPEPGIDGVRQQFARTREWWNEGGPAVARVLDATVPGPDREIPVRLYVPNETGRPVPAYIYFHGGGFRIGSPGSNDRQLRELAAAWGGIVVSADYAHMPEKRFPAPVLEAAAVYEWLARHGGQWGIDPLRLAFGGSSAGANVAIGGFEAVAPQARASLRCGAFIVGVFDDALDTGSMRQYGGVGLQPSPASARQMFEEYAGAGGQRQDTRFNALLQDATRWPALFLAAAEVDVFRDSSVRMAERAKAAGGSVQLNIYAGMTHLFFGYTRTLERARECLRDLADFLGRQLPP